MSQTYYLWTSYKGITNRCDTNSGNTFKKWIQLLHRSEGRGNQNYYTGKIGHVTYNGFQVLDEDFYNENINSREVPQNPHKPQNPKNLQKPQNS